jgi:hypothetical protein
MELIDSVLPSRHDVGVAKSMAALSPAQVDATVRSLGVGARALHR